MGETSAAMLEGIELGEVRHQEFKGKVDASKAKEGEKGIKPACLRQPHAERRALFGLESVLNPREQGLPGSGLFILGFHFLFWKGESIPADVASGFLPGEAWFLLIGVPFHGFVSFSMFP